MNAAVNPVLEHAAPRADAPNFNSLARVYRWMEWLSFGPMLWRCRCVFLSDLALIRRALTLGDGDGRFTARLLNENPSVDVDVVDVSSAMLSQLVRRCGSNAARVQPKLADARTFMPPSHDHDLIVTHFFLDCLTSSEVVSLAVRLRAHVRPNAAWLVSEFAIPQTWFGRVLAHPVVAILYGVFGILTGLKVRHLPNHREALVEAGFTLRKDRRWLCGLLVSELWIAS
jgi:ubiquinone/menaquinone biosynthesis C-methylase UbiE